MNKYFKNNLDSFKSDAKKIVQIRSVDAPKEGNDPFGKEITRALETTLEVFKSHGFRTFKDKTNYYGYAEIGPEKADLIGVLCHVDVVPEGDSSLWETDPFKLVEKDNKLYARGIQDDKGPALTVLYALNAFLETNKLNKRIRFIFGTNEESGKWKCIDSYKENEEIPKFSIVPDAWFPSILTEKHIKRYSIKIKNTLNIVRKLGAAPNVVPGSAIWDYSEKLEASLKKLNFKYKVEKPHIIVLGDQGHAMLVDKLQNAIVNLAIALVDAKIDVPGLTFIGKHIGTKGIGGDLGSFTSKNTGYQTINVGIADFTKDHVEIILDTRIPFEVKPTDADLKVKKLALSHGFDSFDVIAQMDGYYYSLDTDLMKNIMIAYRKVTGDNKTIPAISGGGTYARALPNSVVFGFGFLEDEQVAHQPNEYIDLSQTNRALEIYLEWFKLVN